jgi:hypothetical protein
LFQFVNWFLFGEAAVGLRHIAAVTDHNAALEILISGHPLRRQALEVVANLNLPDCWIGAGFVRDAVWDHLHGHETFFPSGDVDVIWFASETSQGELDRRIEQELRRRLPGLRWSVKNQARMHLRNGDRPYASVADAMCHWPETATAVAVRYGASGSIEINAPFGLDDLFGLRLRPTPAFLAGKLPIFEERVSSKRWIERYPLLTCEAAAAERS